MREFLAMCFSPFCLTVTVIGAVYLTVDCIRDLMEQMREHR